jgi:hypothetical protein
MMLDEVGERVIQVAGWLLENSGFDFDSGGPEAAYALAADLRVGIFGRDNDSRDAGCNESVGARAGSSVVGAGFESDVSGGSGWIESAFAGLLESDDLGVVAVGVEVRAFRDYFVLLNQNAAYLRVGASEGYGFTGEGQGSLHKGFVLERGRHASTRISC